MFSALKRAPLVCARVDSRKPIRFPVVLGLDRDTHLKIHRLD